MPEGGCGPCHVFAPYYALAFALQPRENHRKTSVRAPEGARLICAQNDSFVRLEHRQAVASTGLLAPVALGLRVGRRDQPSFSVGICRVAELGGSPRQLTLSRSSRSEL
jgi:hypothetical protein